MTSKGVEIQPGNLFSTDKGTFLCLCGHCSLQNAISRYNYFKTICWKRSFMKQYPKLSIICLPPLCKLYLWNHGDISAQVCKT